MISRRKIIHEQQKREQKVVCQKEKESKFSRQQFELKTESSCSYGTNSNSCGSSNGDCGSNMGRLLRAPETSFQEKISGQLAETRAKDLKIHENLLGDALDLGENNSPIQKKRQQKIVTNQEDFYELDHQQMERIKKGGKNIDSKMSAEKKLPRNQKRGDNFAAAKQKVNQQDQPEEVLAQQDLDDELEYLGGGRENFDPYSIYGEDEDEEEDVWYSEERLLEVSVNFSPISSSSISLSPFVFRLGGEIELELASSERLAGRSQCARVCQAKV